MENHINPPVDGSEGLPEEDAKFHALLMRILDVTKNGVEELKPELESIGSWPSASRLLEEVSSAIDAAWNDRPQPVFK